MGCLRQVRARWSRTGIALLWLVALAGSPAPMVRAATTYTVGNTGGGIVTTGCTTPANTTCTFLGALSLVASGDTITFNNNVPTNTRIFLSSTASIAVNLTIDGNGRTPELDGSSNKQVLTVAAGVTASITGVWFLNGRSTCSSTMNNTCTSVGGGVVNNGTLALTNCTLLNNRAVGIPGPPGGITLGLPGGDAKGGAIFNTGILMLTNTDLNTNDASAGMGASGAAGGPGGSAFGGGIYNTGTVSITGGTMQGNRAIGGTGGTQNAGSTNSNGDGGTGNGGGIANVSGGTLSVTGTVFIGNSVKSDKGGNAPMFQGSDNAGGGIYTSGANVTTTVTNGVFTTNTAFGGLVYPTDDSGRGGTGGRATGGAIYATGGSFTLKTSTFINNAATGGLPGQDGNLSFTAGTGGRGIGAGLFLATRSGTGTATVVGNTFDSNQANGGSFRDAHGGLAGGGGMYVENGGTGAFATVAANLFTNNIAQGGASNGGAGGDAYGGGAAFRGSGSNGLDLLDSTLNGNQAVGGSGGGIGIGGGVSNGYAVYSTITGGTLRATNLTVNGNTAGNGGGIATAAETALVLKNSLVVNNTGGDTLGAFTGSPNLTGSFSFASGLQNNGGPTPTFAIGTSSLAFNAGDLATCQAINVPGVSGGGNIDQRGAPRTTGNGAGAKCSIGAYEPGSVATTTVLTVSPASPVPVGTTVTLTAQAQGVVGDTPDGTVTFFDATMPLGSVSLTNGRATLTKSDFTAGSHNLTAQYAANGNYASSTSTIQTLQVGVPNFTVTGISPVSGDVRGGGPFSVSGMGFVPGMTSVTVGGAAVTMLTVTATSIRGIAPAGTAGAADVVVTVNGQSVTLPGAYIFGAVAPAPTPTRPAGMLNPMPPAPQPMPMRVAAPTPMGGMAPNPVPLRH